ncbi:MAG: glycosyltransferase family 4 protein [Candidatus Altiarchaeota archaeon]|nr:glycosyltransferase family 4 protein [Candidatus Altiarchaeota archaeon]
MKVCMVIYMFPPVVGGGEIGAYETARAIVAQGHEVHVLTTWHKGLKRHEGMEGIKVHRLIDARFMDSYNEPGKKSKFLSSLAIVNFMKFAVPKLLRFIEKEQFDVIHAEFAMPAGFPTALVGRFSGKPTVVTLVGGDIYTPSEPLYMSSLRKLAMPLYKTVFSADVLTAISSDTAKRAGELGARKEILLTPYGIDLNLFRKKKPDEHLIKKFNLGGNTVLLSVCRLSKRKGLGHLLDAIPKVLKKDKNVKLLIVGDGPERNALLSKAESLGIQEDVVFAGAVPHDKLDAYYNISDIFVLPSLHEGLGIVFMEAMACGLPVVTTNNGGMVDVVEDGKTGFLLDVGDTEGLTKSLLKLIQDKKLRSELSKNAEKKALKEFSWERAALRYTDAYKKAVK